MGDAKQEDPQPKMDKSYHSSIKSEADHHVEIQESGKIATKA